jgi:hypothetical protein
MKRFVLLLLVCACGRHQPLRNVDPPGVRVDAGTLPKPSECTIPFGGPSCCGSDGRRVGSADCVDEQYVCSAGAVCSCEGQPQTFHCSDFCGSDAFVDPVCGAGGWFCPSGLKSTADCPAGTCWGEPGDLCPAVCVNGVWTCDDTDGGIRDPET